MCFNELIKDENEEMRGEVNEFNVGSSRVDLADATDNIQSFNSQPANG